MTLKKKLLLSALPLALLDAHTAAYAQTSVTLYGLIDTSATYVNHAQGSQHLWALGNSSAGNLSGSRWGLKGQEDLGGGLKALFTVENGFNPSTGQLGQGNREFGRQSFVGLQSDTAGLVTLGRQYDPLIDLIQPITADNYFGSAFATAGDVDNYDNSFRVNNAVKYASPVWAGLQFELMYSFGGVAGSTSAQSSYSGAVAYATGPFSLAAGYYKAANSQAGALERTTWSSTSDGAFNAPINTGYETAHTMGIARAAGQYLAGPFTLGAGYSNVELRPDGASAFSSSEKYNTGQAFLNYQVLPPLLLGLGYSYTRSTGDTAAKYHQVSLGADYNLSKRTDVYMTAAYQHASGETGDGAGGTAPAVASVGSYGYSGTGSQVLVNLGIRHKF